MACETGTFFCLVRDHASAMIRFSSPPVRGRMPSHGRDARPCSSIGFGALVYGTRGCRFESRQGHFGAVAQWQGVPSATGRSRVPTRRLHDMRHAAACKRRHSEERRHVKTARPRDGIRETAASRRRDADVCSGSTPASQAGDRGSNPVIRSIRMQYLLFLDFRAEESGDA